MRLSSISLRQQKVASSKRFVFRFILFIPLRNKQIMLLKPKNKWNNPLLLDEHISPLSFKILRQENQPKISQPTDSNQRNFVSAKSFEWRSKFSWTSKTCASNTFTFLLILRWVRASVGLGSRKNTWTATVTIWWFFQVLHWFRIVSRHFEQIENAKDLLYSCQIWKR